MWVLVRDFLVNMAASAAGEISSPTGMTLYVVALCCTIYAIINWHRKRKAQDKRGMDSWYFIAFSGVVAAAAIGVTAYGVGLRKSSPESVTHIQRGEFLKNLSLVFEGGGSDKLLFLTGTYVGPSEPRRVVIDVAGDTLSVGILTPRRTIPIDTISSKVRNEPVKVQLISKHDAGTHRFYWGTSPDTNLSNYVTRGPSKVRVSIIAPNEISQDYYFVLVMASPQQGSDTFFFLGGNDLNFPTEWEKENAK